MSSLQTARDGDLQRGLQRGVGHVGQVGADGGNGQHRLVLDGRRQVERGQDQQLVAVQRAQLAA